MHIATPPPVSQIVRLRIERTIAWTRAPLVAACLLAIYLDPTEPRAYVVHVYTVLVAYTAYTVGIAVWLSHTARIAPAFDRWSGVVDILTCGALVALTAGPSSPIFPLFTFLVAAAAYRGSPPALLLAAVVMPVALMVALYFWSEAEGASALNFLIIRIAYILAIAALLGTMTRTERAARSEAALVARALGRVRDARTYMAALAISADEFGRMLRPRAVLFLVADRDGERYAWRFPIRGDASMPPRAEVIAPDVINRMWMPVAAETRVWFAGRKAGAPRSALDVADQEATPPEMPPQAWEALEAHTMMGFATLLGEQYLARVYVLDPQLSGPPYIAVRLFHAVASQLAPALLNLYLVRRVRRSAAAIERERLAREVHDHVLQSLIGVEMQVAAARKVGPASDAVLAHLAQVRESLRSEIAATRELMNDLRPLELTIDELVPYLRELVERFIRDTGIAVRFAGADVPASVWLSPLRCGEIASIVREALANIRKHSGATEADVAIDVVDGRIEVRVEDNGRGFPFEGTVSGEDLLRTHRGPAVILQRARRLGASVNLTSTRGRGARLTVEMHHA